LALVLLLVLATACHRYETVSDLKSVAGTKVQLTLTPEARGTNSRRLGGVPTDVFGVLVQATADSVVIRADEVRFADLGTVPFAQGELRFAARDVESVRREVFNRRKTIVVSILAGLGILATSIAFGASNGLFTGNSSGPPTPR